MSVTNKHRSYAGEVPEGTTPPITFTIVDPAGIGFKPAALTLTLYVETTKAIINNREKQPVLDANGVTVTGGGAVTWQTAAADHPIVTDVAAQKRETHIALFEWTWDAGARRGKHEVSIDVVQLVHVPEVE